MDVDYRRQRSQFGAMISEADPIPSQSQSRSKSTISSLLLSTFSNNSDEEQSCKNDDKKKKKKSSSRLRGLGCSAASSQQVSVPAVIRTSADWEAHRKRKPKKGGKDRNALLLDGSCQDVWCDAAASVDCVVARARNGSRGKIDSANTHNHREVCWVIFVISFTYLLALLCIEYCVSWDSFVPFIFLLSSFVGFADSVRALHLILIY